MTIVSIVGLGYWGPNILRILSSTKGIVVKYVCDISDERLRPYLNDYTCTRDYKEILGDPDVDAVFLITPISTHYSLIHECITAGKHVFVEKPICKTLVELDNIYRIADSKGVDVFCDYTFTHSDKIHFLKTIIAEDEVLYVEISRENFGAFSMDGVDYDLLPHDLSVLDLLFEEPICVTFVDKVHRGSLHVKSILHFTCGGVKGMISVSWLNNSKKRSIKVFCKERIIEYDDTKDMLGIYNYRLDGTAGLPLTTTEQICMNYTEPLRRSIESFIGRQHERTNRRLNYVVTGVLDAL